MFNPCCSLASVKGKTKKKRKRDEDSDEADEFSDSGSEIGKHHISASSVQCTLPSIVRHMLTMLCLNPKPQAFLCLSPKPSFACGTRVPVSIRSPQIFCSTRRHGMHPFLPTCLACCLHSGSVLLLEHLMCCNTHVLPSRAPEMDPEKCKFGYSALACTFPCYPSGSCNNEPQ